MSRILVHALHLNLLLKPFGGGESQRTSELKDEDTRKGPGIRPVLQIPPLPSLVVDPAEDHRLWGRGVGHDEHNGYHDATTNSVQDTHKDGEEEGHHPDNQVTTETRPHSPQLQWHCDVEQTLRGHNNDGCERGLRHVLEHGREELKAQPDNGSAHESTHLGLHTTVGGQTSSAEGTARRKCAKKRSRQPCGTKAHHFLSRVEVISVLQCHAFCNSVSCEEGGECHEDATEDER
mmetsp:Transcript_1488/g.4066  ORF Transcript_1488/g.4066 Transcript_1488/m.4066 type:complete len:234 (+) Transcript_1488:631-1332(+)